jgi:hypothetical protein
MICSNVRSARWLLGGIAPLIAGASACQLVFPYGAPGEASSADAGGDAADATNPSDVASESALEGGSCADVACQAQPLVPQVAGANQIRVANASVYWSTFTGDVTQGLSCLALAGGGPPVSLVQGAYIWDFVVDATHAYVSASTDNQFIVAYPFPTGQPCQSGGQSYTFSPDSNAEWTAIDDANVYWYHQDNNGGHFIASLPKDAGADAEAGAPYTFQYGYGWASAMTTYGGTLYFSVNYPANDAGKTGDIDYVPVGDGGGPAGSFSGDVLIPAGVTVDATGIYWANVGAAEGTGSVWVYPKGGGGPQPIANNQANPQGVYVDDSFVYWTNTGTAANQYDDGAVMRAPKTGSGQSQPTVLASGQAQPVAIAGDQENVYWVNCGKGNPCMSPGGSGGTGAVMKLAKCACP